ncbi:hypothetical protein D3C76_1010460 [compost metagenome]
MPTVGAGEAGDRLVAAGMAVAAEYQQTALLVGAHLAQGVHRQALGGRWWEGAVAVVRRDAVPGEVGHAAAAVEGARARVDDQLLALLLVGHAGVAQRHADLLVAVVRAQQQIALQFLEVVPGGLLVRDVYRPLQVGHLRIVQGDFAAGAVGRHGVHAKARGLALDAAFGVLVLVDVDGLPMIEQLLALGVAGQRAAADGIRRQVEGVRAVADPGDADARAYDELVHLLFSSVSRSSISATGRPRRGPSH